MVPMCDLQAQYAELQTELEAALLRSAKAGQYIMGPNVKAFEREAAAYADCKYAIGVGNGTDALHISLMAAGIGPGDEVITTPFTFIATCEAINLVGATPVFVDIVPDTFNINPALVEQAITPKTRAILPVHLYGLPCEMNVVLEIADRHGLIVIEDCAQSFGARYRGKQTGTMGMAGCLSFFPSKNLGCMGDGGMILTNDDAFHERAEMLRRHGGKAKYHHTVNGVNSRLDDIQAAVLRVKLPYLDAWNQRRQAAAARYADLLSHCPAVQLPANVHQASTCVFHQYTVLVDHREQVQTDLRNAGIATAIYYPVPLHRQEVNRSLGHTPGAFPVSERVAARCLSLPMSPHLTEQQQIHVADQIAASIGRLARAA
ncbi:MAG: DegT/DnrJ/EryC1/StrS family aminotransferase [Candidatus Paceibacterota bacterium]